MGDGVNYLLGPVGKMVPGDLCLRGHVGAMLIKILMYGVETCMGAERLNKKYPSHMRCS